tara:strand:+ start:5081 stop:5680 length:600 start_codon:yes stop_codon:yes gene_type:complete
MIKSDKLIYSFLILSLIAIIYIFYQSLSEDKVELKIYDEKESSAKKIEQKNLSEKENIIENIEYYSIDNYGNKFEVNAKEGITNKKNINEVLLKNVEAKIILSNLQVINITSNSATYNKENLMTNFREKVNIKYLNHEITSEELNLYFKSKVATVSNNVIYKGLNTNMQTDNIKIDFNNKSSKIFMNSKDKKIKINTGY